MSTVSYMSQPPTGTGGYRAPGPAWRWALRLAALAALGISGYMLSVSIANWGAPAGCGPGSACEKVLTSDWSKLGGVPVSALAAAVYLAVLVASLFVGRRHSPPRVERRAWMALAVLAVLCAGAAAWFIGVQLLAIKSVCAYCMAAHACGLLIAALVLPRVPVGRPARGYERANPVVIPPGTMTLLLGLGVLGLAVLAGGQFVARWLESRRPIEVERHEMPAGAGADRPNGQPRPDWRADARRKAELEAAAVPPPYVFEGGDVELGRDEFPVLGPADKQGVHVMAVQADYTCHHCRDLHHILDEARERYAGQLAVMVLPMPLDHKPDSHPLARTALAVWLADPEKFADIDAWLFEPETPRTPEEAREYAVELVGEDRLAEAEEDERIDDMIGRSQGIFNGFPPSERTLPKLMLSATASVKTKDLTPEKKEQLFAAMEQVLGLEPGEGSSE